MIFGIVFCLIFTAADVFPEGDSSRTDSGRASGIDQAPWFSFPYPGQWGNPTFLASAIIAMISGLVSEVPYATAAPSHTVVLIEQAAL